MLKCLEVCNKNVIAFHVRSRITLEDINFANFNLVNCVIVVIIITFSVVDYI